MSIVLKDAVETIAFGVALGELLESGDVVVLDGTLGAGKTTLTKGIALGLGVTDAITSPTFVISHVHHGQRAQLVHVDAYRLGSQMEFDDLDLDADLDASVTVVEWGQGRAEGLSDDPLLISLRVEESDESRIVTLTALGERWRDVLQALERWKP